MNNIMMTKLALNNQITFDIDSVVAFLGVSSVGEHSCVYYSRAFALGRAFLSELLTVNSPEPTHRRRTPLHYKHRDFLGEQTNACVEYTSSILALFWVFFFLSPTPTLAIPVITPLSLFSIRYGICSIWCRPYISHCQSIHPSIKSTNQSTDLSTNQPSNQPPNQK